MNARRGIAFRRAIRIAVVLCVLILGSSFTPARGDGAVGPVPVSFAGQLHTALGTAVLTVTPDDHLLVSNLGSSGLDGVEVAIGDTPNAFLTDLPLDPGMPVGSYMESRLIGFVGGLPDQPAGVLGLRTTASGFEAIVDFTDLGSPTYTVELRDENGALLHSEAGLVSGDVQMGAVPGLPIQCWCDWKKETWTWRVNWPWNTTTPSGMAVDAHEITFRPDTPTQPARVTRVQMVAADMPAFTILDEQLGVFDNFHSALGDVVFEATGGALWTCCIGSSGEDGVEVLGAVSGIEMTWSEIDPSAPDGSYLELYATGSMSGAQDQPLGSLRVTDTGATYEITADYSPVGSTTQLVRIFDDGMLVAEISGVSGVVATVPSWPSGCSKRIQVVGPWQTACYAPRWPVDITFTLPGLAVTDVVGDEIAVLAEAPSAPLDALNRFRLTGADLGPLVITSESTDAVVSVEDMSPAIGGLVLAAPFPNPFRSGVSLMITTSASQDVRVDVLDVSGRVVRRLGAFRSGVQTVTWDGVDAAGVQAASGVYFFRVSGGGAQRVTKGMLVR